MEEVNTVVLENGLEYMEMDELVHNGYKYIPQDTQGTKL